MQQILLCSGGCRSGKSGYAQRWVEHKAPRRVYLATAYARDAEMALRIQHHQQARGEGWVCQEPDDASWEDPALWLRRAGQLGDALLLDCLTLWTAACMDRAMDDAAILERMDALLVAVRNTGLPTALVTNELGMGLVPETALGRRFRDLAGLVNQRAAACADAVVFMVSGLPLAVKGQLSFKD